MIICCSQTHHMQHCSDILKQPDVAGTESSQAKYWVKAEKHAKSYGLSNNVKFRQFLGFYSIFCLGRTKNEVHICNLHAKTQLLMYDKGGLSTKKISSPEGRWRTVRKPGLDENSGFEWKNLYFQYQWPKRTSFQGYSFSNSILMQIWHPLVHHAHGASMSQEEANV